MVIQSAEIERATEGYATIALRGSVFAKFPGAAILVDAEGRGTGLNSRGDTILAEPGAVIGFAGPRVIKQTIGQDLPEGFQTAEFLLDHGMIDAVVARGELRDTAAQLLRHMTGAWPAEAAD